MSSHPEGELSNAEVLLISDIDAVYEAEADTLGIAGIETIPVSENDSPTGLVLSGLARLPDAVRIVRMTRVLGRAGNATLIKYTILGSGDPSTMCIAAGIGAVVFDQELRRAEDTEVEDARTVLSLTTWDPTLSAVAAQQQEQSWPF